MDDDPLDPDQESDDRKTKGWGRLKGKLPFRRRQTSIDSADQLDDAHVSDFLYSTGQSPERKRLPAPKIDVSAVNHPGDQSEYFEKFTFSKPPRAVGLRVQFGDGPPEIIGAGGDETEEPVIAVSRRKYSVGAFSPPRMQHAENAQLLQRRPANEAPDPYRPEPAPRIVTPPVSLKNVSETPLNTVSGSEFAVTPEGAQKSLRRQPEGAPSGDLRQRMRADEGRAFLSASYVNSPKTMRRRPVGESESETSSVSPSPAVTPQQLSPPPSRDSDSGILHPPQYPRALMPSHGIRRPSPHDRFVSNDSSLRPPSSGSESGSHSPARATRYTSNMSNGSIDSYPINHAISSNAGPAPQLNYPPLPFPQHQISNEHPPMQHPRPEPPKGANHNNIPNQRVGDPGMKNCMVNASLHEFIIGPGNVAEKSLIPQVYSMSWQRAYVHRRDKDDDAPTAISIIASDNRSSFTDTSSRNRKFKLERGRPNVVTLYNAPSGTFSISIDPNANDPALVSYLQQAQSLSRSIETTQTYHFGSLAGAHAFQAAVTGFAVKFDGIASVVAISRRRMVVPIYKTHEATDARIEIVQGKGSTHLVAFFTDYALADCLYFELKSIDVFEASESKEGLFCVKLVDAKFSLPDPKGDERLEFVALHAPEYASQHEDITIGFHDENVRDEFAAALPAAVTGPKRFTLKRRI